jgi:hypothetical protein
MGGEDDEANGPPKDGGETFNGGREDGRDDEVLLYPSGSGIRLKREMIVSYQTSPGVKTSDGGKKTLNRRLKKVA